MTLTSKQILFYTEIGLNRVDILRNFKYTLFVYFYEIPGKRIIILQNWI